VSRGTLPALLAATALLGACKTQVVDTVEEGSGPPVVVTETPAADSVVSVPLEAYRPIDEFFDQEGFLAGDILEIDCSLDPFKTRFVALIATSGQTRYVSKEEGSDKDFDWVRLKNLSDGVAYQPNLLPTVTFGSHTGAERDKPSEPGVAPPRLLRFVATQEIRVRFHHESERTRPVWFRARAVGTPSPLAPETLRDSIYAVKARGVRAAAPELGLALSLDREGEKWVPRIAEPAGGPGAR
jgi:hypothetical protein